MLITLECQKQALEAEKSRRNINRMTMMKNLEKKNKEDKSKVG
jgi:hypothetical protein